ncbi:MAG: PD40 domain-containing protein [Phycisphaeraceae bacterium]|nr:MAG: PD40 domain-containing protein [Phycisphaeraceae bacterium]
MSGFDVIRSVCAAASLGGVCLFASGLGGPWDALEGPILTGHVRLTDPARFSKAGEAYFSPDGKRIIFQAVEVGEPSNAPYSMYLAELVRGETGEIVGLAEPVRISPPGSANTCGWFHPTDPARVMFGSTLRPPRVDEAPGFKVGQSRYVWAFPSDMEVCTWTVPELWIRAHGGWPGEDAPGDWNEPRALFTREGYDAECTWSPDGRHVLYARVEPAEADENGVLPPPDADIWIYDTLTQEHVALVAEPGYDGGPFFSADGRWICYRSDRARDDHLQIYIAELAYDGGGAITGIKREIALTANEAVNWCPYWHPSGRFLLYATSELGHDNYEIFAIDTDPEASVKSRVRVPVTRTPGADVLPAFDATGEWMMWTSRRQLPGETGAGSTQLWVARFRAAPLEQKLMMPDDGAPVSN